jgi:hypothetical protein
MTPKTTTICRRAQARLPQHSTNAQLERELNSQLLAATILASIARRKKPKLERSTPITSLKNDK